MAYELSVASKDGHFYTPIIFDDLSEAVEAFKANERVGHICTLKHLDYPDSPRNNK